MKRALTPPSPYNGDTSPACAGEERHFYAAGCTFIQCRAISSRVATQTLGREAT